MPPSRRQLVAAAGALSAASAGAAALGYHTWWDQAPAPGLAHVSADEAAFFDALADAIFPPHPGLPLRGREAGVSIVIDGVISGMAPVQRNMLRLSVHALDQYPRPGHGQPFRSLQLADAVAILGDWTRSDLAELRGVVASLYIFVAMAYSLNPQVAPRFARSFPCGYGA